MNKKIEEYNKKAIKIVKTIKLIGIAIFVLAILISIVQYTLNKANSSEEKQNLSISNDKFQINIENGVVVYESTIECKIYINDFKEENEYKVIINVNEKKEIEQDINEQENTLNIELMEENENHIKVNFYVNGEETTEIFTVYYIKPYEKQFLDEFSNYGVVVHYRDGTKEDYNSSNKQLKSLGVKNIRTDFLFRGIVLMNGKYDYSKYDAWVEDINKTTDINILALLGYYPLSGKDILINNDAEINEYLDFVNNVMNHFTGIKKYELLNEINLKYSYRNAYLNKDDVYWYSKLLNSFCKMKSNKDYDLISTGTYTPDWDSDNAITSENFYQYVYNTGGSVNCNSYSFHPYCDDDLNKLREKIQSHVKLFNSFGGFSKLNATEYGSAIYKLDEEGQGEYNVKETVILDEQVELKILYDLWTIPNINAKKQYGILRSDYTPMPSYYSMKNFYQNTNGAEYIGSLNITNGLEAHTYDKDGHPLIIAWSNNTDNTYNFTLNQMTAKDIYGKEITPDLNGQIQITTSPVYLYNVPTNYFYQAISNTATTKYNEFTENYADQISKVQGLQQTINTLNQRMKDLSSTSNLDETTSINLMKQHFNLGNTLIQAYKSGTLQIEYVKLSSMLDALNDIGNSFEDLVTVSAKTRNANISETLGTINKADNLINDNDIEMIYPSKILQFSQDFYEKASYINGLEEENAIKTGLIVSKNLHSKLLSDWATQFANLYIDTYIKNNPVTIDYSETNPTNQNVTATLRTNAQITINNNSNSKVYTFTQNGTFTFDYTIKGQTFQQTATVNNIDKTAPTIEGVENGRLYLSEVTPKASDTNLKEVLLYKDNNQVQNYQQNTQITEDGHYKLVAKDSAENQTSVEFDISRNPAIIDYSEVNLTNQDVVATVNSNFDVNVKNNSNQKSYTFKENGEFTFELNIKGAELQLTAKVDNIDKTPPTITDVEDKKQYINKVTPKISDDNLNEVKLYFDSEEVQGYTPNSEITGEGFYKLVAKDLAGNETSVEFTIIENLDEKYQIKDGNILNIKNNTNQDTFRKKLKMSGEYSIYRNDTLISDNDKIATGDKLRKSTGEEYTLIVSGDINNDGDVNIKDIVMLRKYLLERNNLNENSLLAADCNLDGKDISIKDLIRMRLIALERDVN